MTGEVVKTCERMSQMKRNELKELGLDEDVINKIMALNGSDIEKAKANSAEAMEENKALKAQLEERDKDLKDLQAKAKDNSELSESYKELQTKYDKDTAALANQLKETRLNSALDGALTKAKVRNTKAFKALLNLDEIQLKDGELTGLDSQVKEIKQSDPYLFDAGNKQEYTPTNGEPAENDPVSAMVQMFKNKGV